MECMYKKLSRYLLRIAVTLCHVLWHPQKHDVVGNGNVFRYRDEKTIWTWTGKILISINYYYYLIIIIPITLFINKKCASYSDYFELCRSQQKSN